MKPATSFIMIFLLVGVITPTVFAQTFSIQGVLRDPLGRTVEDGSYSLTFRIYDVATGGSALWTETQGSVAVQHGVFTVELGTVSPMTQLSFSEQYYIGITVESGPELEPRIKMTNSPSAYGVFGVKNTFPSAGNVGVGVPAPQAGLHIKTQTITDNLLKIESTHASGGTITVKADGKLGVNVEPEQALDIQGNLKMRSGSILFDDGSSLSSAYFGGSASSLTNNGNIIITTDADDDGSGEVQILSGAGTVVTVANNGNVGIGTKTPSYLLDINGTARATTFSGNFSGNYSGNGSSINSLNASAISSGYLNDSYLESTIDRTAFNASDYITALGGLHVGGTSDPGTANLIVDGKVGIGTANPSGKVEIRGGLVKILKDGSTSPGYATGEGDLFVENKLEVGYYIKANQCFIKNISSERANSYYGLCVSQPGQGSNDWYLGMKATDAGGYYRELWFSYLGHGYGNGSLYQVAMVNTNGRWYENSDRELKEDIQPYSSVLSRAMQMNLVSYKFKRSLANSPKSVGFIAQDVMNLFPEMVHRPNPGEENDYYYINYSMAGIIAIGAIQELKQEKDTEISELSQRLDEKDREISELKSAYQSLLSRMNSLEKK